MKTTMFGRGRIAVGAMGVLAFAGLLSPEGQAVSQERSSAQMVADAAMMAEEGPDAITFAKHVAPILQRKCQVCHQPDSIAPMSLMTYDEVRTYAAMIKDRVERRQMPPWHINRSVGIKKFKNDRGLTADEIETIGAWVDAGAPFGAAADMPPPAEFPDPGAWQLVDDFGEPDLIIPSESYTLEAVTQDKWFRPLTSTGLTEARWVKAIEIRPVGKGRSHDYSPRARLPRAGGGGGRDERRSRGHQHAGCHGWAGPVHGVGSREGGRDLPRGGPAR